jgi:hypothetical protein
MIPYIGITDFTCFEQVRKMLYIFTAHKPQDSQYLLHVGVMMSYKTLHGIPSIWQKVFPSNDIIASIFASDEVYNCLHYADYHNNPSLGSSLAKAIAYCGPEIHALQLDMIWPDPNEIASAISASKRPVEVILQLGRDALKEIGNDPLTLIKKLRPYQGVIQRVLLDKSMGRGLGMDADALIPFARAIHTYYPEIGLGAAGGLGPGRTDLVKPLFELFSDLSVDAQARLRPSGNILDLIDWEMAKTYLIEMLSLLTFYPS